MKQNDFKKSNHKNKRFRCNYVCDEKSANSTDEFIEHVKLKHIQPQKTFHKYRCLWANCSVYGQASLSRTWLERHVIDHVDKYPFRCIMEYCQRRFRTETLREKHVMTHMNSSAASAGSALTHSSTATLTAATDLSAVSSRLRQQTSSASIMDSLKKNNSSSALLKNDIKVPFVMHISLIQKPACYF